MLIQVLKLLYSPYHVRLKLLLTLSLLLTLLCVQADPTDKSISKTTGPPSFFIRDKDDGLCLAGSQFKRCGIDTLWFVQGKSGDFQLHRRQRDEIDTDDCLGKHYCHLDISDIRLSDCNHCGAKKWNVLGDDEEGSYELNFIDHELFISPAIQGYYITQDRQRFCLSRNGSKAFMHSCNDEPTRYWIKCKYIT